MNDTLLRPRHPNAIFAKPVIKKKIEDKMTSISIDTKIISQVKNFQRFSTFDKDDELSSEEDRVLIDTTSKSVIRGVF